MKEEIPPVLDPAVVCNIPPDLGEESLVGAVKLRFQKELQELPPFRGVLHDIGHVEVRYEDVEREGEAEGLDYSKEVVGRKHLLLVTFHPSHEEPLDFVHAERGLVEDEERPARFQHLVCGSYCTLAVRDIVEAVGEVDEVERPADRPCPERFWYDPERVDDRPEIPDLLREDPVMLVIRVDRGIHDLRA